MLPYDLHREEKLVLIGLCYWLMNVDGVISPEETEAMSALRRRLRVADWDALVTQAKGELPDVRHLIEACKALDRPSARQTIYEELVRLAAADEVVCNEVELLNWLALTWGFVTPDEVEQARLRATLMSRRAVNTDAPAPQPGDAPAPSCDTEEPCPENGDEFDLLG